MIVFALDPGNEQTAFVIYDTRSPRAPLYRFGKHENALILSKLPEYCAAFGQQVTLAVEMIASYGMPVGREVFETCVWIGRFIQAWPGPHELVYRREVKLHLCASARAKDGNVRAALLDRFGPGREKAIGTKKQPGPLYGVAADVWAALGVAVTYADARNTKAAAA